MPPRPYRAKLAMAHKRFQAQLSRMLKPDRAQTFDFENKDTAISIAEGHLRKFIDGQAEVWEREGDAAAPTRMIWPVKVNKPGKAKAKR